MELRVPGLMRWQLCVMAALTGILASRYPLAGAVAGGVLLIIAAGREFRVGLLLAACLVCGIILGIRSTPVKPEQIPSWLQNSDAQRVEGVVAEVAGLTDRRLRIMLEKVRPEGSESESAPGKINWIWDQSDASDPSGQPRPLPGQRVILTSKIRPVSGFLNRGLPDFAEYWARRDVWYNAWTNSERGQVELYGKAGYFTRLREAWRIRMVAALEGDSLIGLSQGQAMLPALIFGDRYWLDSATFDLFSRAGLVHSLALSGQHLGLALLAATVLAYLLSCQHSAILLHLPRRTLVLCLGLPFAALYLWLGNAPPSLVRAFLMMFAGALLWVRRKPVTLLDIVFLTALCFLLIWPMAVFDLSVQLSMLSVLGIALSLPLQRELLRFLQQHLPQSFFSRMIIATALLLCTSLAVQIPTLPVVLHSFGRVTPFFALNLIWLPVLGFVVLPGAALGLLLSSFPFMEPFSSALFSLAVWPGDAMIALLQTMHNNHALPLLQGLKPTGLSMVGLACAIAALAALIGRARSGVGVKLLLAALILLPSGVLEREYIAWIDRRDQTVRVRMLDVGQGQAIVVEWPQGRMLLDAGGMQSPRMDVGRDIVARALTVNRPPRLEIAMASHGDLDHARGMPAVLELFRVRQFAHSVYPLRDTPDALRMEAVRTRRGIPLRTVEPGDKWELGSGLILEILHPPAQGRFSSNNSSIIARLTRQGQGLALFCADAEIPALQRTLSYSKREGRSLEAQVLVIPHHGSGKSLLPEFYDAVNPNLALISYGAYNSFGFPKPEVLEALESRGIVMMSSARHGEISIQWDDKGRTIRTARPGF